MEENLERKKGRRNAVRYLIEREAKEKNERSESERIKSRRERTGGNEKELPLSLSPSPEQATTWHSCFTCSGDSPFYVPLRGAQPRGRGERTATDAI